MVRQKEQFEQPVPRALETPHRGVSERARLPALNSIKSMQNKRAAPQKVLLLSAVKEQFEQPVPRALETPHRGVSEGKFCQFP